VTQLPTLPAGVWRHYKGQHYQVLGYGHDADFEDRVVVIYMGLELDGAKTGPRFAVREYTDFLANVHIGELGETWETCPGRYCPINRLDWQETHVQRFTYVGASWEGQ
jgi:hypothetical protein